MQYSNTLHPRRPWIGLDIKTVIPKYGDLRVKDNSAVNSS